MTKNNLPTIYGSGSGTAKVSVKLDMAVLQKCYSCRKDTMRKILHYAVMSGKYRTEITDKFREYQNSRNMAESVQHMKLVRK